MASEIVSVNKESGSESQRPDGLGDRLDGVIGEASSGMGALLSELIRRSLKTGVSDIGNSLGEYAEEKVEEAVERQMPAITEAADAVAASTSNRIVKEVVEEWTGKSAQQQAEIEAKIQHVESTTIDRTRTQVEEAVAPVRKAIDEARSLAAEHHDASEQKLHELRLKGKQGWKKLKDEIQTLIETQQHLREENKALRQQVGQLRESTERQAEDNFALRAEYQSLEGRLLKLEQPKGLRALFSKMGGGSKKRPKESDVRETGTDDSSNAANSE
jgi:regulator of replication initiation timing